MFDLTDTICALSSAPGRSGIAVVRISGQGCFSILDRVFQPAYLGRETPDRRAVFGRVIDPRDGGALDEALATRFRSPHSYTGEDVAEISVHGSPVVVAHLLDFLCLEGARLAEPGEFTLRAFLHGRMDLAQAEAVRDVIEAQTLYQLQVASRQKAGELSHRLEPLRRRLTDVAVELETMVEFSEEDLKPAPRAGLAGTLEEIAAELSRWVDSFRAGRLVRTGFTLAIAGRPNVGKSSLFNALLAEERSIVTEIPGTTRDLVSESVEIAGIPVRLIDTAGLREGLDRIEQLGVDRSLRTVADSDAVMLVLDGSRPPEEEDERLRRELALQTGIVAFNKSDLGSAWTAPDRGSYAGSWPAVSVSALTGSGLDLLRLAIQGSVFGAAGCDRDGVLVTNARHHQCLRAARQRAGSAAAALRDGLSEEFALVDLRGCLQQLGEITGEHGIEELLGEIFRRFCIGK